MILAPTLTLNTPARGFDADATAFAVRSGATDVAALSAFVKGVKELGLWNNMVCWPLRSSQNAGNGDTVYSLGGLGTFNGTRVNGPAWTADGLIAIENGPASFGPDSTQHVTSSFFFQQGIRSAITVTKPAYDTLTDGRFFSPTSLGLDGYSTSGAYRALSGAAFSFGNNERVSGQWDFVGFGTGGQNWRAANSSYTEVGTASSANQTTGFFPLGESNNTAVTTSAFTIVIDGAQFTQALYSALRSLYKSTLGQGLGLP